MSAAEQSSSSGNLIQDELQLLGGTSPVVFGCETRETGEIFSQEADGIMGLGNSKVSVINQVGHLVPRLHTGSEAVRLLSSIRPASHERPVCSAQCICPCLNSKLKTC